MYAYFHREDEGCGEIAFYFDVESMPEYGDPLIFEKVVYPDGQQAKVDDPLLCRICGRAMDVEANNFERYEKEVKCLY